MRLYYLRKYINRFFNTLFYVCFTYIKYLFLISRHKKKKIRKFKNIHYGKTVICIGSGPSMASVDLKLLNNQIVIFVNSSYKLIYDTTPKNAYWIVQDCNSLMENSNVDRSLFSGSFKSVHDLNSFKFKYLCNEDVFIKPGFKCVKFGLFKVPMVISEGVLFSEDLDYNLNLAGNSVIFSAIQLAYYLGAKKILLLGVDMNYGKNISESYFDSNEINGRIFYPVDYLNKARPAFINFKNILSGKGIDLVNCSKNTCEDVLDKSELAVALLD